VAKFIVSSVKEAAMIARSFPGFLCSLILFFATPALSSDVVFINFDHDPDGVPLANGAVINTAYASLGVTFSAAGPGNCGVTPDIYARTIPISFGSSPNVVSTCPAFAGADISENGQGMVRVDMARPANMICIDVHAFDGGDRAVMRAYSFSSQLIGEVFSTPGVSQKLCINACGIYRVEFSGAGSNPMLFDNLTIVLERRVAIDFDFDTNGTAISHGTVVNATYIPWGVEFYADPVPEPCGIGDFVVAHSNQPHSFGSSPNVVTTCHSTSASDISENINGIVHAAFGYIACQVCIDVHVTNASSQGILRGYDGGGTVVATAESTPGGIETICISDEDIFEVTFSGLGNTFARFDNLTVLFSTNVADVPETPATRSLAVRGVFPNPASRSIQVALTLATTAPAKLQLVDVSGRILASQLLESPEPGDQLVRLSPGDEIPRGVYFVRLKQGGEWRASKVVFLP
jgi:hypothetical protein